MICSVYHLFCDLVKNRDQLRSVGKLEQFRFDTQLLSCRNKGQFPDLAIRLNKKDSMFTGGELIELKDSLSYTVSSFNSTIPTGEKDIRTLIGGKRNAIREQMEKAGNDILSLPVRQVYYLVRGKKAKRTKVGLVHGKFFETIQVPELISQSFLQALEEAMVGADPAVINSLKQNIGKLFTNQGIFSKTRTVNKASVSLRFRIMTEVLAEGNFLNTIKYPQITDDTLNFLVPYHSREEEKLHLKKMKTAFEQCDLKALYKQLHVFTLKHLLNGPFLVFQAPLKPN